MPIFPGRAFNFTAYFIGRNAIYREPTFRQHEVISVGSKCQENVIKCLSNLFLLVLVRPDVLLIVCPNLGQLDCIWF